jgi:hypothetical protein
MLSQMAGTGRNAHLEQEQRWLRGERPPTTPRWADGSPGGIFEGNRPEPTGDVGTFIDRPATSVAAFAERSLAIWRQLEDK